jgi:hypothetical protein
VIGEKGGDVGEYGGVIGEKGGDVGEYGGVIGENGGDVGEWSGVAGVVVEKRLRSRFSTDCRTRERL